MQRYVIALILLLGVLSSANLRDPLQAGEPRVLIEAATLELIASAPDIVTPVGLAFDAEGRLLVIESHTHQRPKDYTGPAGDRIKMLADSNGDGKLDKWSVFAEGFQQSMNLLTAGPGQIYLVTRRSVDLLIDEDLDGKMDRQQSILKLETKENYPHNALSGIAHDGQGGLYIGMGENFGGAYKLIGSDGSSHTDHGGVGTIFHCTADGKNLRRFCNGFWNPFSICRLPNGSVFTVDNDPDSSPPCRLIHAVETGDYGHRWEYSRAGIHPLQAWNGELPGTLPMLAGTGEAPCAVVPHRGHLWVTSWGDHHLERFMLTRKGASYSAEQEIVVQGDSDFRPTGCAVAPDGSLYFADWVSHSYPVHGKGRIWRLSFSEQKMQAEAFPNVVQPDPDWQTLAKSTDRFERQQAVLSGPQGLDKGTIAGDSASERLVRAQAFRWKGESVSKEWLRFWLKDSHAGVRLYAVRWIADERIQALRDDVAALLDGEVPDQQYYLAVLSALEWLDGEPKHRRATLQDGLLVRELKNKNRSPELHSLALRMVSPDNKFLSVTKLREYLVDDFGPLRLEAIRSLALQTNLERFELLAEVAQDTKQSELVRAEALAGLAATEKYDEELTLLSEDSSEVVREEALRVLRLTGRSPAIVEEKPAATDLAAWNKLLAGQGDADAGRRLFFSARGARCGVCHQYDGRGGKIGPDLTRINQSNSREQIIASILQPSREMAPHYQPWTLLTDAGKALVALRLHKAGDGGKEVYADSDGKVFQLRGDEIEVRQASDTSIMPAGLEKTVSVDQLRDLVEYLSQ